MTSISKFRVFGRVRPFIDSEFEGKSSDQIRSIVEMVGPKTVLLDPKENYSPKAQFEFDDSLWSIPSDYKLLHTYGDGSAAKKDFASQHYVYNLVAKEAPVAAFDGVNSTIMSYGQTGGGKTYTMMGKYDPFNVCGGDGPEGIIPRVCHDVFKMVETRRKEEEAKPEKERRDITVEVTFVEIYMEKVRDLLDKQAAARGEMREARIRVDPNSGPFVEDVTKYRVSNWSHCCKLLEQGSSMRTTSANVVHQQSSRSHAIFTLTVLQSRKVPAKDKYAAPTVETKSGRINLVDLAGSERGGFTDYVKESSKINTSLLALRRVIDTLVERQRITMEQVSAELQGLAPKGPLQQPPTVPYRDSVLTWLLSDSMGGNAMTTMIAALSPHEKNFNDTLATLQWSSKARNLVGVVKVNDSQSSVQSGMLGKRSDLQSSIHQQRQTVDGLRQELENRKSEAEELDKRSLKLKKIYMATLAEKETVEQHAAAYTLQRQLKQWAHRRRMATLRAQLDQLMQEIGERMAQIDALNGTIAANSAAIAAQQAESADQLARVVELEAKVAEYERCEEEFQKEYEVAMQLREEGESSIEELKQQLDAKAQAIEKEYDEATAELAEMKERHDSDCKRLEALELEISETPEGEEERLRAEAEALESECRDLDAKNQPLRQRRDELLQQKADLQKKIDEKNAKKKKK
uniref:Kinesin-like protein n=1 Tax=Neobodo designis TaxID=312471 RepID=A0A7S1L4R6_NEODS|mmetsp:Transcript_14605/g.45293  ORF Transcript_14605/g.45293 Transcript_14605/m.45293 type:complete len:689 (+) Transcript_14605:31-2097(+)